MSGPARAGKQAADYGALSATAAVRDMLAAQSRQHPGCEGSVTMTTPGRRDSRPRRESGCHFADGLRSVDYVLVWEEEPPQPQQSQWQQDGNGGIPQADKEAADPQQAHRRRFEANLLKAGLEMEEECSISNKKMIHFVKLFIPWDVMCYYAEAMCLRAPLLAHPNPADNWSGKLLETLRLPNPMDQAVPNQPADYYTCSFRKSKLNRFLGSDNRETYFTATQRHQVAREILCSQAYGKGKKAEIGIDRLLEAGVYSGAFPLHDGPYEMPPQDSCNPEDLNPRQILHAYWARWGLWFKYQPLDSIREYYGEKIGLYFAWLGKARSSCFQ